MKKLQIGLISIFLSIYLCASDNTIDTSKGTITITNANNLEKALEIAEKLSGFDIYIYKTTTTKTPYFIIYAVNINRDYRKKALEIIQKDFKSAYIASNQRTHTLASNNFFKNTFKEKVIQSDNNISKQQQENETISNVNYNNLIFKNNEVYTEFINPISSKKKEIEIVVDTKPIVNSTLTKEVKQELKIDQKLSYKLFVGLGVDISLLNVTKEDQAGSIILNNSLDSATIGLNTEVGIIINEYIFSIHYDYVNLEDIILYNLYASFDYKFPLPLNPYLGISLGISDLKWKVDPLVKSQVKDNLQSSNLFAIQGGTLHYFKDNWTIFTKASYQFYNHQTQLISIPAYATIKHKDKFSIGFGARYSF